MDWLGDLLIPTYVAGLALLGAAVKGVWRLIQRLTHVEHGVDRLEDKIDDLATDLREHMKEEGRNVGRLETLMLNAIKGRHNEAD
jgi:hypothetical protein